MSKTLFKPNILRTQINKVLHKNKNLRISNIMPSRCIAKYAEFVGNLQSKERCKCQSIRKFPAKNVKKCKAAQSNPKMNVHKI